jgi:FG-GAP repeat
VTLSETGLPKGTKWNATIDHFVSPNAASSGSFGASVAARGVDTVVGAPLESAYGGVDGGHAYLF